MSSVNISLNQRAYKRLVSLKRKDESFSEAVLRIGDEKDIRRCFGLLADDDGLDEVRQEAEKIRREPWRGDRA